MAHAPQVSEMDFNYVELLSVSLSILN